MRLTIPVAKVLAALLADPAGEHYGLQLMQQTGLASGTLYPILTRLQKAGWLTAEWGMSARNREVRIYRLTPAGRKQLERKLSSFERLLAGIIKVVRPA